MNEADMPLDPLGKMLHLMEECAEVQQAVSKLIRFGATRHHPRDPNKVTNKAKLLQEMQDLKRTIEIVEELIRD